MSNISFIGGGNMAASIIGGLIANGFNPQRITASDPMPESLSKLRALAPINTTNDNNEAVSDADVVVLAVKPQIMKQVVSGLGEQAKPGCLFISIAAGITAARLEEWLGGTPALVRCMPNTPALVQTGATALYANAQVSAAQQALASDILDAVGLSLWVKAESELDAVTAVSGSGPAYFFLLMETMKETGEKLGLSPEVAEQLTLQTALGAAKMAISSDVDAAELRRRVSSPNGTTERAIGIFEQGGLRQLVDQALTGARDRSIELAAELD